MAINFICASVEISNFHGRAVGCRNGQRNIVLANQQVPLQVRRVKDVRVGNDFEVSQRLGHAVALPYFEYEPSLDKEAKVLIVTYDFPPSPRRD